MAKFDKFAVMAKIAAAPMVPVFYNKDVEVCKNVIKACYEGGVRAFEFTNRRSAQSWLSVSVLLLMPLLLLFTFSWVLTSLLVRCSTQTSQLYVTAVA